MRLSATVYHNDHEFEVEASYSPYRPATMYARNGDPGNPEEGGEVEDMTITFCGVDVTDIVSKEIFDACEERIEDELREE